MNQDIDRGRNKKERKKKRKKNPKIAIGKQTEKQYESRQRQSKKK
jgi:hypothetical protein